MKSKGYIKDYYERTAGRRVNWKRRNRYYHKSLERYFSFAIPEGSRVLEVGCSTGDLLAGVKPSFGMGIDFSAPIIEIAKERHPHLQFRYYDIEEEWSLDGIIQDGQKFDYIIMSDILHVLWDLQKAFHNLKKFCHHSTRIIISAYNYLWEPLLRFAEFAGLKEKSPIHNWLTYSDIVNILEIEGYQIVTSTRKVLIPFRIPLIDFIFNRILVNLPLLNQLGLVNLITARMKNNGYSDYSVSIVIPARNEKGNIHSAITRVPEFGLSQEFIFVEGNSSDGTFEEMNRVRELFSDKNIKVLKQSGKGKGQAVRQGFEAATGDVLMILDADLTTPPEDLPKFYFAIAEGRGEFINGCRLVYPMEKEAMRFLNLVGNKFFSIFFTYLLGQRLKDTLCGTKVLFKTDYEKIKANRSYFGDFDPFGDFDLLFGAAKLNLKIVEIIVRYKERKYGSTQISRFRHGLLLLRMSLFAAFKIKFR